MRSFVLASAATAIVLSASLAPQAALAQQKPAAAESMRLMGDAIRTHDRARLLQIISPKGLRIYDAGAKKVVNRASYAEIQKDFAHKGTLYQFLLVTQGDNDPGGGWYYDVFRDAKFYNWKPVKPGKFAPVLSASSEYNANYYYVQFEQIGGKWKLAEVGIYAP